MFEFVHGLYFSKSHLNINYNDFVEYICLIDFNIMFLFVPFEQDLKLQRFVKFGNS